MPPPSRKLIVRDHPIAYYYKVTAPHSKELHEALKFYPGVHWEANNQCYAVPKELSNTLHSMAKDFGLDWNTTVTSRVFEALDLINPVAREYQKAPIAWALSERSVFINWEMGLGKSFAAIEVMRLGNVESALIVCPANVRLVWDDELKKHWPGCPKVNIVDSGDVPYVNNAINITSYELFVKKPFTGDLNAFILDEAHNVKNNKANRGEAIRKLFYGHAYERDLYKIALTGTPICDQPIDLWHQLECFWPDRFGDYFEFRDAYCDRKENKWATSGFEYFGVNAARTQELSERIRGISSRITRAEVADELPEFEIVPYRIRVDRSQFNWKAIADAKDEDLEEAVKNLGNKKIKVAIELALDDIEQVTHVCLLTYNIELAIQVATELRTKTDVPVMLIHGQNSPVKKRHAALAEARALPKCFLVVNMDCIQEGVDLTKFTIATFVQLHFKSKVMRQVLLRFSRLNSKTSSMCRLLVLENSIDEVIASSLMRKNEAQNKVVAPGQAESGLKSALDVQMSDEEFYEQLRHVAATKLENKHGY